jgi:hypothetical protein
MSSRVDGSMTLRAAPEPLGFGARWMHEMRQQTLDRAGELGNGIRQMTREPLAFIDYESRWMVSITASYPFLGLWVLVSGGLVDRFARDRPVGAYGIGAVSGEFFFRFVRLGLLLAGIGAVAFHFLERWPLALAGVLAAVHLVFDYAQVRAVVEDRRSMLGALRAAWGFVRRHWTSAIGLYVIDWAMMGALAGAYVLLGPEGGRRFGPDTPISVTIVILIAINQLYVVARLWIRLVFWASATSLFQSRLAHAGYVARPLPVWPDSASAEALRNLELRK